MNGDTRPVALTAYVRVVVGQGRKVVHLQYQCEARRTNDDMCDTMVFALGESYTNETAPIEMFESRQYRNMYELNRSVEHLLH